MYGGIRNTRTKSLEYPLKLIRRVIALWLYEKTVPAARRKLYQGKGNQREGERGDAVWKFKKSNQREFALRKEWRRHRTPLSVNGAFRCLIINSETELSAMPTPALLSYSFSISHFLVLFLSLSVLRQLENSAAVR